jgi:chemotaxis protein MotB
MRFSSTRCPSSAGVLLALLLLAGCVTRGTHQEVLDERSQLLDVNRRLDEQVKLLSASNESLGAERVALIDEIENLRETEGTLERDVRQLRKAEAELSENLAARESELASRGEEMARLRETYEGLVEDLESEVASGQIEIEQLREGLRLNLAQEVLFASGSARVNAGGQGVLKKVAERVRSLPHRIVVVGHTDNVRVRSNARWASNWELAGDRASGVVRLLVQGGVAAERLRAVSRGQFDPVALNDTPQGRAKNRRIEITLQPEQGASDPAQGAGTGGTVTTS